MDKLCGGTLFVLMSNSRKPMQSNTESFRGNSNNQAEFNLICALSKLVNPEYHVIKNDTAVNNIGNFKKCVNWGASSFAFQDIASKKNFQKRFEEGNVTLRKQMNDLVEQFLDEKKDAILVKAIIETIIQDSDIPDKQQFHIGKDVTKEELSSLTGVMISDFLLGIWYYVYIVVGNNTIGADTYNRWCPPKNRSYCGYEATIGEDSTLKVEVKRLKSKEKLSVSIPQIKNFDIPAPIEADTAKLKKENPLSEDDDLLLQKFKHDYDDLIQKCMNEDHSWGWEDGSIPQKISDLHINKWESKSTEFQDFALKTTIMNILNSLKQLSETMDSDNPLFISPEKIRRELRKQYVKIKSSDPIGVLPYDAFIDDLNDNF